MDQVGAFDLNIVRVLEHWTVPHAIRELIANALDEAALTGTRKPDIYADREGCWHIRDWGRGIQYGHLTQEESTEKLEHPTLVIGKFGVGLKDALATLERHDVIPVITSRHAAITIGRLTKHGFSDIETLHAMIAPSPDPQMVGTDITLRGVTAEDVSEAQAFFLEYSGDQVLDHTAHGTLLQRQRGPARVYVNGLVVAEEEYFLFSYNITSLTPRLRKALNRERANVGRMAYTDRVKAILLASTAPPVIQALVHDVSEMMDGRAHDEVKWQDVAQHALRWLNAQEKVVFVTGGDLLDYHELVDRARNEGYRIVQVPPTLAQRLETVSDTDGQPMRDLNQFLTAWNQGFQFQFVEPSDLPPDQGRIYALTPRILASILEGRGQEIAIRISETMRLDSSGYTVLGLWDPVARHVVIWRRQLESPSAYIGTLIHECIHAVTGTVDGSRDFENALTRALGDIGAALWA